MFILTLTCWNYSIKFKLYSAGTLAVAASGSVERVGLGGAHINIRSNTGLHFCHEVECAGHLDAIALVLSTFAEPDYGIINNIAEIAAVGHRVVHGGSLFSHSVVIDSSVMSAIRALENIAPLHNAPNNHGIDAAMKLLPDIPNIAVFDTAFHQTIPEHAYLYPLPYAWYEKYGIRRYGFHGASHLYLGRKTAEILGRDIADATVITVHVENGMSLCAIKEGESIDTSMGFTPLEGLVMGTRSGDIDPGIPPFIMQKLDITAHEVESILNQKSGCAGIVGRNVTRYRLLEAAIDGDERSLKALRLEAHRLKKYIGAYLAISGPVDAITFSSGVAGSEWFSREMTLTGLETMGVVLDGRRNRNVHNNPESLEISASSSSIKVFVLPTDEDLVIAQDVVAVLSMINQAAG